MFVWRGGRREGGRKEDELLYVGYGRVGGWVGGWEGGGRAAVCRLWEGGWVGGWVGGREEDVPANMPRY